MHETSRGNLLIVPTSHRTLGFEKAQSIFQGEPFAVVSIEDVVAHTGHYLRHVHAYKKTVLFIYDLQTAPRIGFWRGIVAWIGSESLILDASGRRQMPTLGSFFLRDIPKIAVEFLRLPLLLRGISNDLQKIPRRAPFQRAENISIAYIRSDLWFGTQAGGSVTHIAGVVNLLALTGIPVFLLSPDHLRLIDASRTPVFVVRPSESIQNIPGAVELAYNQVAIREGERIFAVRQPTLVYQRYSPYNYTGANLAARHRLPFVLEYNGSEIWIAKNWGRPMSFLKSALEIEKSNLEAADAIIVVSEVLKEDLLRRGVAARKVLVNPNGVDISVFDPERVREQSIRLRQYLAIDDKIVVGFVGTFGRWHGAEVLATAIPELIKKNGRLHFLMVGDGTTASKARQIVEAEAVQHATTFTGMVNPLDTPKYMFACDILVSPHVENPDGSAFFGSPTKLFEYMAMRRGIVASRLGQIAEILKEDYSALLVTPGDVQDLSRRILELADDRQRREALGRNARTEVTAKYTWQHHVERILQHLQNLNIVRTRADHH